MWTRYALVFCAWLSVAYCQLQGRVVNGTATMIEKYPFMVSIRTITGTHSCGGSIIAPKWILTAGHCVSFRNASSITIQYGSTKIEIKSKKLWKVKNIILHEDYDREVVANDIALLELYKPIQYNYKTIAPIHLPAQNFETPQTQEGVRGTLIGWGRNATGGVVQDILQEVNLKIYSDKECKERYEGNENESALTENNICAGLDEGYKGQCAGDSGGPLIYQGHIQLGIVSWSERPCAAPPFLGVLTKVSHFFNWIRKNCGSCV